MTVPFSRTPAGFAGWRALFFFHTLFTIIRSSTFRLDGLFLVFPILFFFLSPWLNPAADAMTPEEGVSVGIKDLLAQRRTEQVKESQQQKNLQNMEAIIRKLEQEIDRDLAKLCSKIAVPVADATGAAQSVANAANAARQAATSNRRPANVTVGESEIETRIQLLSGAESTKNEVLP